MIQVYDGDGRQAGHKVVVLTIGTDRFHFDRIGTAIADLGAYLNSRYAPEHVRDMYICSVTEGIVKYGSWISKYGGVLVKMEVLHG